MFDIENAFFFFNFFRLLCPSFHVCLFIVYVCMCVYVCMYVMYVSVCMYVCLFIYLSICSSVRLSLIMYSIFRGES
jgi:hypothetical protein